MPIALYLFTRKYVGEEKENFLSDLTGLSVNTEFISHKGCPFGLCFFPNNADGICLFTFVVIIFTYSSVLSICRPISNVVADFGCGEAAIAQSVANKVHSFDLVAKNKFVTACDMAKVCVIQVYELLFLPRLNSDSSVVALNSCLLYFRSP